MSDYKRDMVVNFATEIWTRANPVDISIQQAAGISVGVYDLEAKGKYFQREGKQTSLQRILPFFPPGIKCKNEKVLQDARVYLAAKDAYHGKTKGILTETYKPTEEMIKLFGPISLDWW